MKFSIPSTSTVGELKKLCTTLSVSALGCHHTHQGCLLFNGNRLRDDATIRASQITDGVKLILFLRHHHNCAACMEPSLQACPTERHVSVIIVESLNEGRWDLRVVGDKGSSKHDEEVCGEILKTNEKEEEEINPENTEQPWQRVRYALSCLHGEYDRRAQEEKGKESLQKLERELSALKREKETTEQVTEQKVRVLIHTETEIAQREEELQRVKLELEETRQEVEQVRARSRSASVDRVPESFIMDEDEEESFSRSAPAAMSWAEQGQMIRARDASPPPENPEKDAPSSSCCDEKAEDPRSPTTNAMLDLLASQVEQLQAKMDDEVRRTSYCSVCYTRPFVWVFKCGHAKCDECAVELQKRGQGCPECRKPLEDPRRLFWAACG